MAKIAKSLRNSRSRRATLVILSATVLLASRSSEAAHVQETKESAEHFEVVAIHPSKAQSERSSFKFLPGGALRAENVSLKVLMEAAYSLREEQISGGEKWTDSERFDVIAKPSDSDSSTPSAITVEKTQERIKALLNDRFHLALKREPKMASGYFLLISKSGTKMEVSASPEPPLMSQDAGPAWSWQIKAKNVPMPTLTAFLSARLHAKVVDHTGLSGHFNFELRLAPDGDANAYQAASQNSVSDDSLNSALIEQLGLKLDRQKIEMDSYVIEHADKPTGN